MFVARRLSFQAAVRRVRDEWESKEREKEDIMVMALAENQGQRDSNRRLSSLDTQREGSVPSDRGGDSAPDAPPPPLPCASDASLEDRAEALLARAKAKEEEEVRFAVLAGSASSWSMDIGRRR